MLRSRIPLSFDQPHELIEQMIRQVEKVIVGKKEVIEKVIIALLCGGHILLEDVPGVGKTMLCRAVARSIGCSFKRIQCTSDLLPSDITGVSIYNQKIAEFEFRPGPIMANIVLADELNRTSPKTQSSLLEAMEEHNVTADGTTYALPQPFLLFATQNPLDYDGTFTLPEAQLDRFLIKIKLGYPEHEQEAAMLGNLQELHPVERVRPVLFSEEWLDIQKQVRSVHVEESMRRYVVSITSATRQHSDIALGASPRASIALMKASQANAFMRGRTYVIPDDIKYVAIDVLNHRLILSPEAEMAGVSCENLLRDLIRSVQVPLQRQAAAR